MPARANRRRAARRRQVRLIKSQSRHRAATRRNGDVVNVNASSRAVGPPDDPRCRRRRGARAHRAASDRHSRPGHGLRNRWLCGVRCHSRSDSTRMRSCGHHPAPLSLRHDGKRSCKTREHDPADHGIHLKAQPAGPFSSTIGMMRPAPHWFQFVACGDSQCSSCRSSPPSRAASRSAMPPLPSFSLATRCVITVQPWNAPRSGRQTRSSVSRYRLQFKPLRLCRISSIRQIGPKILRGTVRYARSGSNRAAAS